MQFAGIKEEHLYLTKEIEEQLVIFALKPIHREDGVDVNP